MQLSTGHNKVIKSDLVQVILDRVNGSDNVIKAYAFLKSGVVTSDVVFSENLSDCGVEYTPDQGKFVLDLTVIPTSITKVVIAVSIEGAGNKTFGQFLPPLVEILDDETLTYQLSTDGRNEKALILTEIYRHNKNWKVKALACGFIGGISALLASMKIDLPAKQNTPVANHPIIAKNSVQNKHMVNDGRLSVSQSPEIPIQNENNVIETSRARPQVPQEIDLFSKKGMQTMFGKIFKRSEEAAADLKAGVLKFKSKKFLAASIAGAFMVSAADGSIDSEEKKKLLAFVRSDDALSVFDAGDVVKIFKEFEDAFDFDADAGTAKALKVIGKIAGNSEQSKFLIRMIVAIGSADGDFDDKEKAVVRTIGSELGMKLSEFGL